MCFFTRGDLLTYEPRDQAAQAPPADRVRRDLHGGHQGSASPHFGEEVYGGNFRTLTAVPISIAREAVFVREGSHSLSNPPEETGGQEAVEIQGYQALAFARTAIDRCAEIGKLGKHRPVGGLWARAAFGKALGRLLGKPRSGSTRRGNRFRRSAPSSGLSPPLSVNVRPETTVSRLSLRVALTELQ